MTDDLLQRIRAARSKPSLLERIRASRSSDSRANEDVEGPFAIMRPSRPASAPNIGDALVAMQPEKVAEFAGEAGSLVEKSGFQFGRSALNTVFEGAAHMVELPAKGAKAFLQAAEPGMRRLGIVPDALPSVAYQQAVEEYRPMGAEDAAEAIRGQKAPPIAGMEGGIADKVGAGVGYAAQAVLVPGSVGAKLAFGATEAAASGFVTNLEVAKAEGASPQEALGAALAGAGIQAAASTLPLHKALTGLEKASGGLVGKALTDAIVFGGAGAGQSALNDVVLEHATGKDREILKNAAEAGMLGVLTGPIVTALSVAAMAGAKGAKPEAAKGEPEPAPAKPEEASYVRGDDMPPDAELGQFRAKDQPEAPFARGDDTAPDAGLEMFRAKGEPITNEPLLEQTASKGSEPKIEQAPVSGDGKTRDTYYHGTASDFSEFKTGLTGAIHFTKSADDAARYSQIASRSGGKPRTVEVRLEIKNDGIKRLQSSDFDGLNTAQRHAKLKAEGYDGYTEGDHAVVFSPEQVQILAPKPKASDTPPVQSGNAVEPTPQPKPVTVEPVNSEAKQIPAASEPVAEPKREDLPRRNGKIDARAMKRAGWKWMGGVYSGDPNLQATKYLGDGWFKGKDYRLISGMNDGLAESEAPLDRRAMSRGPSVRLSASSSEPRWILNTNADTISKPGGVIRDEPAQAAPAQAAKESESPPEHLKVRLELERKREAFSEMERKLQPPSGAMAVGPAQFDPFLKAEVLREFLSLTGKGMPVTEAVSKVKEYSREIIKKHNAKRPNDNYWKRADMSGDAVIEDAGRRLSQAESAVKIEPVAEPVVPKVEKPAVAEMPKGGAEAKTSTQSLSLTAKSPWESFLTAGSNFIGGGKTRPKEVLTDPEGRYVPRDETAIEASLRRIADRFHTLRRVEKEAPAPGQFSDAEVRMHGRAAYKHRQLEREQRSATNLMREAGVTAQDMADYATARHAEARNAIIRERTGGKTENGSGMNLARAKEILARATPAMKQIMEIHDRVRDRTREFMVESGLISRETADAWQRTFGDTYTPLKTIEDPGTEYIRGSGKSLQTRGPETKRAMGRSTEADNPFVQMFQDAQEAIARGEKNIVAQEFGKFAADNPSTAWEFVEPKNGHPPSGEDIFTYKVGGVEHYIRVSDEITLRALKNLDPVVSNRLFRAVMAGSRLMSGFATSRNPDFILPNFVRDLQTAAANISVEQGEKMAAKAVAGSFKAVHQIGKAVHSPEAAQGYAKEYLELGALTDWIEPQTIQKRLSGLDKMLKESTPRRGLREVAEVMNSSGSAVENGTRFAAYKEFRSAGIPAEKAVVLAKELTVNWSKKGEWGPFANSLYLFFSASANGTLRMGQVIRSNPAKAAKVAGAFVATGYAVAALNRAWGGKDEQDDKLWWDKQNDSNKRRYAMIQHQDGETTKMPLAPGWGFFYYLGTKLEEAAHTHKADIGNLVSALAEQTIPVGGGSPAQVVSPWFLDPVVQTSENKDFKGDPIYQERFPGDTAPYASHPDDRASETAKAISKLANELTGGTGVRRGSVDIPPRAIDHVTAEAGSGLGRFLDRVQRVARAKIKGEENPWREWPVISRFKGDKPDTYARDYRANMERLDVEEAAMKAGEKYDSAVVAQKRRAALFDKRVKALREAGMYEEAKRLMAAFNKDFPR